jgi:uncharacterized membrane protein
MSAILQNLRSTLFAGLATLIPVMLTFYFLRFLYVTLDKISAPLVKEYLELEIPGIGILFTLLFIYLLGLAVTNFLGEKILSIGERIVDRVPFVNTIYTTLKQITDTFTKNSLEAFDGAVYIQYPRQGLWTMAFVSGESKNKSGTSYYHLFVPTTPNPTSGYFLMIPKTDAVAAGMSVEEGLKTIISGGMLAPDVNPILDD